MKRLPDKIFKMLQRNIAERAIGASTLRNQGASGVIQAARDYCATKIKFAELSRYNKDRFDRFLEKHTKKLIVSLPEGAQHWGTARKALNIFLRDALYNKYFSRQYNLSRCGAYFELPLDEDVANGLREELSATMKLPKWKNIKGLSCDVSAAYQEAALLVAKKNGIDRVHLDLIYWRNRNKTNSQ